MDVAQNIVALPNVKTATKSRRPKFGHHTQAGCCASW
jgi:hypothetical protein